MDANKITAKGAPAIVHLRRNENSIPWGFRMQGGIDYGMPLYIQKVNPKSIAGRAGLMNGDGIIKINNTPTNNMSHSQAKMEIIRAGNEVDFFIQRGAVDLGASQQQQRPPEQRSVVTEEGSPFKGDNNPNQAQSRSFRMLQMSLDDSAAAAAQYPNMIRGPQGQPASIFDARRGGSGQPQQ